MPGYDGITFMQKIREIDMRIKFIVISGHKKFEYAKSAMKYNVEDYLIKPISKEELANVNYYVTIQSFRFNNRFEYVCKVPEPMLDQYQIPNMTLQPLVENAIMHGLEKKVGKGRITIEAYATASRLVFAITDDGIGIQEEKLNYLNDCLLNYQKPVQRENTRYHVGIALLNINKQIKLK